MKQSKLTIIVPAYNEINTIQNLIDKICQINIDKQIILVDDCSMKNSTEDFDFSNCEFDLNVYRVTDDVYFNVPGAVNLGADKTQTEWFIKQDMDTIIPEETMSKLLELIGSAPDKSIYKFYRTNGTSISNANKITPGQFMIRKDDFWSIGAWDEDFCEDYGMNDPAFFWRASQDNYVVHEGYDLHVTIDSDGESDIERDCFVNSELLEQKKSGKVDWSDDYIRFNWKQVEI